MDRTEELSTELCVELSSLISHMSAKHDYLSPDNCAVVPKALVTLLAATIALNYQERGHATLVDNCAKELGECVKEANAAAKRLTPDERRRVNPMAPCTCGGAHDNDEIGDDIAATIADALGVPRSAVKAVKVDASKQAIDPLEAAALAASDDPAAMAEVKAEIDRMLTSIFGGNPDSAAKH